MTVPLYNLVDTWNSAGTSFTALQMNVTDTAAAATSKLIDLQVGGTSVFTVGASVNTSGSGNAWDADFIKWKTSFGTVTLANTNIFNDLSWTVAGGVNNSINFLVGGFSVQSSGNILLNTGVGSSGVVLSVSGGGSVLSFNDPTGGSTQAALMNEVNNGYGIALRNPNAATHATYFRAYNTGDGGVGNPTNYERGVFDWTTTANVLTIGVQNAGTGSARNVQIISTGSLLDLYTSAGLTLRVQNTLIDFGPKPLTGSSSFGVSNAGLHFGTAAKVVAMSDGGTNSNGWMQWAGQARVTSDVGNSSTTLADVTGLSVPLQAGRTYYFRAYLSFTDAAAGGIKAAIVPDGTLTATAIEYDGYIIDSGANGIKGNTQATALSTTVASAVTTGTAGVVIIEGTITVNVAGNIKVQHAQNTTNGTATTIKRGSTFMLYDMP